MHTLKIQFSLFLLGSFFFGTSQNQTLKYLDPNVSVENRVRDLMDRMTLEEKVYQMNQFVGLDHMRKAEEDLTEEELHSNDAQGFYKGLFSDDVASTLLLGLFGFSSIQ